MVAPRVLMLPGYTQNATVLRARLGAIRKALGVGPDSPDLVFVDPTFVVNLPTTSSADFDSSADSSSTSAADTPRTWWFAESANGQARYERFDETLVYLRDILEKQGPFDGVWGFSQGGAMAACLTLLVENPELHPVFAAPSRDSGSNWPPPQFKFAILGAGFLPQDEKVKLWFTHNVNGKAQTPSLHVLGRGDTIVGEERSVPLTAAFQNPRVEWHEGGHHTPSKSQWRRFFTSYLAAFKHGGPGAEGLDAIPSPTAAETGKL